MMLILLMVKPKLPFSLALKLVLLKDLLRYKIQFNVLDPFFFFFELNLLFLNIGYYYYSCCRLCRSLLSSIYCFFFCLYFVSCEKTILFVYFSCYEIELVYGIRGVKLIMKVWLLSSRIDFVLT